MTLKLFSFKVKKGSKQQSGHLKDGLKEDEFFSSEQSSDTSFVSDIS